ncbi:hypothetical protein SCHPADRAFT_937555 [Schizopora paradoxa]|uniref:TPR-like protein n=1 Tax=Schizopora paradoxa TaxID=27342 RepID=A0A0H2S589_9AGAM|nr:hypothetical protein SCHPADRAFT_937555 [Schizopora paradoxa]
MADDKEKHYWTQLQAALTAGHWESPSPAKTPNGYPLSWSELFRKFKKHSKQPGPPEAVLQTHFLSLLLKASKLTVKELDSDDDDTAADDFALGKEYILYEERREDAQKAYDSLQQLKSSDDLAKLALAYCAYALDRPRECLEHVSDVKFGDTLKAAHASKPALLVTSTTNEKTEDTSSVLFSTPVEVEDTNAWLLMEAIRASCLEGMSHERISPGSPVLALAAYDKGCSLLKSFSIPKSLPTRPGKSNLDSFTRYRELWRWTDMLLWRAISISAKHRNIDDALPLLRSYMLHSSHWSSNFRAVHRQRIFALYLRALILYADCLPSPLFANKAAWSTEMRSVINEYRLILGSTTSFPRAGERNILVEEFVDYCVAGWEACGAAPDQAVWVIDILWWAMRLTFNCPIILRHMTRLLHVSGDHELAKRTLKLYVQIVGKAHETMSNSSMGAAANASEPVGYDDDVHWVQTLVQGARMLCRIPGSADDVRHAVTLVAKAREQVTSLSDELKASVDLADGICRSILAIRERRPQSREGHFSESIALLKRSIQLHPTTSAHYHLAIALSRSIPNPALVEAEEHIRQATETDPKELRHWHLMALLEAKMGEWGKARGVLEAAIDIAESTETELRANETKESGIISKDYASGPDTTENAQLPSTINGSSTNGVDVHSPSPNVGLLDPDSTRLPSASNLLKPVVDHPPPTPREQFDYALQLRMTQLALTELVEGPESVEPYWLEVFEWYSQRRETDSQSQPRSARPSTDSRLEQSPRPFSILDRPFSRQSMDVSIIGPSITSTSSTQPRNGSTTSVDAPTITSPAKTSINTSVNSITDEGATSQQQPAPTTSQLTASTSAISHRKSKLRLRARSQSPDRERENSKGKGKRVQKMLKTQVHNTQVRINTISRKIGHGMTKGAGLQRSSSAPNFHEILTRSRPYQASSIHSRKRLSWVPRGNRNQGRHDASSTTSPPPLPPPPPPPVVHEHVYPNNKRSVRERRLLSDLWLMSAATFRRLEKLDQARGAIQEAEILDEENENVWVQLGLYFITRGEESKAIESFDKALYVSQDDVSATLHLANVYLSSQSSRIRSSSYGAVDLAVGMLEATTKGSGWDIPEAWYLLAKAYHMQGRPDRERECLVNALRLSEVRGVRDIGAAIGWCL